MGTKHIKEPQYILSEFLDVTNINSSELNIRDVINKLCSLCFSEKIIHFIKVEMKAFFTDSISIFEVKEKYLSFKVFLQLLEQLKSKNFENHMIKIDIFNKINDKSFNEQKDSIDKFAESEKGKSILSEINKYNDNNFSHVFILVSFYFFIFICVFKDVIPPIEQNEKLKDNVLYFTYDITYKNIENIANIDQINEYIDKIKEINSFNYTKNACKNILFLLNLKKYEKEISSKEIICKDFFENYGDTSKINDNIKWRIYEKNLNENKKESNYICKIIEGKMTEKEKDNFDIFENIYNIKEKNIKGISGEILKSLIYNNEILIIKIEPNYFKKYNSTIEEMEKGIELVKKSYFAQHTNINTYVQIKNKIINLDSSYDLFMKELDKQKVIIEQNKLKNLIEQLKSQIDTEKEKNKKLERELAEEKNMNKKSEKIIEDLNKELDNNEKGNELDKETKDSLIKIILEKEKNIKELNSKLLRYPISIEENEKLMTINFISKDKKLVTSIVCKSNDIFEKIEGQLYNNYPQFFKKEITFLIDGKSINKNMTLEQNGIHNDSVIIIK